jgi:hypothetical protein
VSGSAPLSATVGGNAQLRDGTVTLTGVETTTSDSIAKTGAIDGDSIAYDIGGNQPPEDATVSITGDRSTTARGPLTESGSGSIGFTAEGTSVEDAQVTFTGTRSVNSRSYSESSTGTESITVSGNQNPENVQASVNLGSAGTAFSYYDQTFGDSPITATTNTDNLSIPLPDNYPDPDRGNVEGVRVGVTHKTNEDIDWQIGYNVYVNGVEYTDIPTTKEKSTCSFNCNSKEYSWDSEFDPIPAGPGDTIKIEPTNDANNMYLDFGQSSAGRTVSFEGDTTFTADTGESVTVKDGGTASLPISSSCGVIMDHTRSSMTT